MTYTLLKRVCLLWAGVSTLAPAAAQQTLAYTEADAHYQSGLGYTRQHNYAAARQEFEQYLSRLQARPEAPGEQAVEAEYQLIVCDLYLGDPNAEARGIRFVNTYPQHPRAGQVFARLGGYYFNAGDYARAIPLLEKAAEGSPEARFQLAMSQYLSGDADAALGHFREVSRRESRWQDAAFYYSGVILFGQQQYEQAIAAFEPIARSEQFAHEVPGYIAAAYYRLGKEDQLLAYARPFLQKGKNVRIDDMALLVAEVYFRREDFAQARDLYGLYASLRGGRLPPAGAYRYGYSLYRLNDFEGAIANFKQVADRRDSTGQYASYYLGISYLNTGNLPYALAALEQAARVGPNAAVREEAAFNHAKVQLELKDSGRALTELDAFLNNYPRSRFAQEARELRGEAFLLSNNYVAILEYLDKEPSLSERQRSQYQQAAFQLGRVAFNAERYPVAVAQFDKSLRFPLDGELALLARFWKAEAYSAGGRYAEAVPLYTQLLSESRPAPLLPDYQARSRYGLGYAYYNTADYLRAGPLFAAYTQNRQAAHYEDALLRLADTQLAAKRYQEAARTYDLVGSTGRSDQDLALYNKGLALLYTEDYPGARSSFQQLVSRYPASAYADDALLQGGKVELAAQQYRAAISAFGRLIAEQKNSPLLAEAYLQRAIANANLRQWEAALSDYRTLLTDYATAPQAEAALIGAQDALTGAGRPQDFGALLADYERRNPGNQSLERLSFEAAKNLFEAEKYAEAAAGFQAFVQKYPASSLGAEAGYTAGEALLRLNRPREALQAFRQVARGGPSGQLARAAGQAARLEAEARNYPQAVRYYRLLEAAGSGRREQVTAWLGLMEAYFALNKPDSAAYFASEVTRSGNVVAGAVSRGYLMSGRIAQQQGRTGAAREAYENTVFPRASK